MTIMRFPGGLRKALTLSYDDGVEQDRTLMEILDAHGLKCTFNLNSGCWAPEGHVWPEGQIHRRLPKSAVRTLYAGVHEVAVHTLTHPDLTQLPENEMVREILEDRRNLEALFGGMVRGAAYPYGTYSDAAVAALKACGIVYCRTVWSSHNFGIPQDWLRLQPTCHHDDPQLVALCDRFLNEIFYANSGLFYLWGHAYEFEAHDNWQRIRDFAAKMGGHEDIWYATNIEVYDYVTAWKQLIVSADGKRACNPTATTLYAEAADRKIVEIAPGETAEL
jgi:peptidoglycan/xylan/chitin deacetylase (PgdA/CDA1 family)